MRKAYLWSVCCIALMSMNSCDSEEDAHRDPVCEADQILVDGVCQPKQDETDAQDPGKTPGKTPDEKSPETQADDKTGLEDGECRPECSESEECVDGHCEQVTAPVEPEEETDTDTTPVDTGEETEQDEPGDPQPLEVSFDVSPSEGLVTVTDSSVGFNIFLSRAPQKDVVIPVVSENPKAGSVSAEKIVFTADNWDNIQQVMIAGTKELLKESPVSYKIVVGPSESVDADFNGLPAVNVSVMHYNLSGGEAVLTNDSLKLDKTKAAVLLYGKPVTIQAVLDKELNDQLVFWEIENTTDDVDYKRLVNVSYDMDNHTITLQSNVVLNTSDTRKYHLDYARTLKVTARHSSGLVASATVELKPYLPDRGFTLTKLSESVRDFITPGHSLKRCENKDQLKCLDEKTGEYRTKIVDDKIKTKDYSKGEMGCGYYDDHTAQILTYDMFEDYVKPAMYVDADGNYYGTRASVLAAARFLVLQFPKDIPYTSINLYNNTNLKGNVGDVSVSTISNYTFTSDKYNSDKNKVRVYGFNLMNKSYNSFTTFTDSHVILGGKDMKKVIPWGCTIPAANGSKVTMTEGGAEVAYPLNGLCCSGFVNWALRNGRFYLGRWGTAIFGQNGDCKDTKGNFVRNIRCRRYWGEEEKDTDEYKACKKTSIANPNSKHENAFAKVNMLKEEDFVKVSDLTVKSDIKAGDLLWVGHYHCKCSADIPAGKKCSDVKGSKCLFGGNHCTKGSGHVAMILGISRHKDKTINKVYVAEAIGINGNHLSAYTIDALKKDNTWQYQEPETKTNCNNFHDTRVIKMDRVYNYSHTKNPDVVKEDLNTYKYTELWF